MGQHVYLTEPYAHLGKRGGRFIVEVNHELVREFFIETIDTFVLCGHIEVSYAAMECCLCNGINLTWLSSSGAYFGRLESTHHVDILKQNQQFTLNSDLEFVTTLRIEVLQAKISNQITLLRRYNRERKNENIIKAIAEMKKLSKKIIFNMPLASMMGYEGMAAKIYFRALGEIVDANFSFKSRSKQPPLDPFNSLLSFGYTLLFYDIYTAICNEGLHPYLGFMHTLKQGHPALASDLIEEWRAIIIDSLVMALVQGHEVFLEDFDTNDETGGVYLKKEKRRFFIEQYEKRMLRQNQYGERPCTFRELIISQVRLYAKALRYNDGTLYKAIKVR